MSTVFLPLAIRCLPLLLATAGIAIAGDFYVSTGGSDNAPGSKVQPWKTIQHAAAVLRPGDTAHVLPGEYHEKIEVHVSGSKSGGFVTLAAEGAVVLSGKGVAGDNMIHVSGRSYVRISGFEIRDHTKVKDGSGIRVEGACDHVELLNNRIHDIRGEDAMGITIYGNSGQAPVSNLLIEGNEIYDCEPAKSEALTLNGNVSGFQIIRNIVRDVNNIGICMIGGEQWISKDRGKVARNGLCKGNKVMRARSSYEDGFAAGIYVDGGKDIVIERNEVTGSNLGIEVGAENAGAVTSGVVVRDNIVWHNEKAGIVFGGYDAKRGNVTGCVFENNICFRNDRHKDKHGEIWIQRADGCTVRGNTLWCGLNGFIINCDKLAGQNTLDSQVLYSDDGEKEANFIWRGREIDGITAYQRISGQDGKSRFEKPAFVRPEQGDFTRPAR